MRRTMIHSLNQLCFLEGVKPLESGVKPETKGETCVVSDFASHVAE